MKGLHSHQMRRGDGLTPTDAALLESPLDFLSQDHLRERQVCSLLDSLATSLSFDPPAARNVLRFVNEELSVHMQDDAEDLFPLLSRRCTAEDGIGRAIARISTDLEEAARLLPELRAARPCAASPCSRKRNPAANCPRPSDAARLERAIFAHAVAPRTGTSYGGV